MSEKRRPGRPATGRDRTRGVRIDDETWNRVKKAAKEVGTSNSGVIRRAVVEHLDKRDQERGK